MQQKTHSRGPSPGGVPRGGPPLSRQCTTEFTEVETNLGRESDLWSVSTAPDISSASEGLAKNLGFAAAELNKEVEGLLLGMQRYHLAANTIVGGMDLGAMAEALTERTAEAVKQQQQRLREKARFELQLAKAKTRSQQLEAKEKEAASQLAQKEQTIIKLQAHLRAAQQRATDASASAAMRLELEEKLIGMRAVGTVTLPALSEWLRLNLQAWKALQAPLRGFYLPEKATGKVVQQLKDKFDREKAFISQALRAIQHETLRVVKQICETPWKFDELRKEKEAVEAAAAAAAEEAARAAEKQANQAAAEGMALAAEVRNLRQKLQATQRELESTVKERDREAEATKHLHNLEAEVERLSVYAEEKQHEIQQLRQDNMALAQSLSVAREHLTEARCSPGSMQELEALLKQQAETIERAMISRAPSRFVVRRKLTHGSRMRLLRSLRSRKAASLFALEKCKSKTGSRTSRSGGSSNATNAYAEGSLQDTHKGHSQGAMTERSVTPSSQLLSELDSLLSSAFEGLRQVEMLQRRTTTEATATTPRPRSAQTGEAAHLQLQYLESILQGIAETAQRLSLHIGGVYAERQIGQNDLLHRLPSTGEVSDIARVEARIQEASSVLKAVESALQMPADAQQMAWSLKGEAKSLASDLQQQLKEKHLLETENEGLQQAAALENALGQLQQQVQRLQQQQEEATQLRVALPAAAGADRALLEAKETERRIQEMHFQNELHKERVAHADAIMQLELAHESQISGLENQHKIQLAEAQLEASKALRALEAELNRVNDAKTRQERTAAEASTTVVFHQNAESLVREIAALKAQLQQQQRQQDSALQELKQRFIEEEEVLRKTFREQLQQEARQHELVLQMHESEHKAELRKHENEAEKLLKEEKYRADTALQHAMEEHNKALERLRASHALELQTLKDKQRVHEKRHREQEREKSRTETAEAERALDEAINNHSKEIQLLQLQHANELQQLRAAHEATICEIRAEYERALMEQQRNSAAESSAAAAAAEETLHSSAQAFAARLKDAEQVFSQRLQDARDHSARDREALIQTHKERLDRVMARLAEAEQQHVQQQHAQQQQIFALRRETDELQRQKQQQQEEIAELRHEKDMEVSARDSLAQQLFMLQQKAAKQTTDRACQATVSADAVASQVDPLALQYLRDSDNFQHQQHKTASSPTTAALGTDDNAGGPSAAAGMLQRDSAGNRPSRHASTTKHHHQKLEGEDEIYLRADVEQQQADLALRINRISERAHAKPYAFQRTAAATATRAAAATDGSDARTSGIAAGLPVPSEAAVKAAVTRSKETHGLSTGSATSKPSFAGRNSSNSSSSAQHAGVSLPPIRIEEPCHERYISNSSLCSADESKRAPSAEVEPAMGASRLPSPYSPVSLCGSQSSPLFRESSNSSERTNSVSKDSSSGSKTAVPHLLCIFRSVAA
ncbi:nuclear mitotic apparatus protein 1 [Cyclospora cayetanensis]|uniref:Nuclear mitotic apparatus protein 1 n=1 Tax=Cyclospora cayetanensis TaxID=88456 RepID=A0A6P6RWI8_9EIME|nr:nuclear mitotic apparatus protein 1 [Cyclospora cayetanensis]